MKTYSMKASEVQKDWYVIDATDLVLGRLAAITATYLKGKHKPSYTPSMDCGDHIIIINAKDIYLSGNKANRKDGKIYYRHTGHPGGIKETTAGKILEGKFPERVIQKSIERMLKKSPLGRDHMSNLYVYSGPEHPHAAQQPKVLDVAAMNKKNKKD